MKWPGLVPPPSEIKAGTTMHTLWENSYDCVTQLSFHFPFLLFPFTLFPFIYFHFEQSPAVNDAIMINYAAIAINRILTYDSVYQFGVRDCDKCHNNYSPIYVKGTIMKKKYDCNASYFRNKVATVA